MLCFEEETSGCHLSELLEPLPLWSGCLCSVLLDLLQLHRQCAMSIRTGLSGLRPAEGHMVIMWVHQLPLLLTMHAYLCPACAGRMNLGSGLCHATHAAYRV